MKIYVIMANDFPAGVMSSAAEAHKLVEARNLSDKADFPMRRVYWKFYEFKIDGEIK